MAAFSVNVYFLMAKIPEHLHLDSVEVDRLMARETRIRIATIGPGQKINLTPMTFGWADGIVYIFGRGQKIANLRRNPIATVLLDTGDSWQELQGIMMHGTANVLESVGEEKSDPSLAKARLNLGRKSGLIKSGKVAPYEASAAGKSRRWIVFKPGDIVSWNNHKLPSRGDA
jgi:nitroimidazol reductase NimA-like FMN-containing flavoprotein (pyridoxamine 5'-phosphate oxidase superfamily)